MPVPVSPKRGARFDGRVVGIAADAHHAAHRLRDHVEGEFVLERAAFAEAFDLGIDDAGVELGDDIPAEPQALDRSRREVLDEHVRLAGEVEHELLARRRFQIDGQDFLLALKVRK